MKKKALSLILVAILLNTILVLSINLEVESSPISNSFLIETEDPAVFDLTIKNLEEESIFEIYSIVGVNITHTPFTLKKDETRKIRIYLVPQDYLRTDTQSYTFEYKIKDSKDDLQSETLTLNIIDLESSFSIKSDPISPKEDRITLDIKNNIMKSFKNVDFKITSKLFEHEETISFKANEKKFVEIIIDKEKLKTLDAGNYIMNAQIFSH